MAVQPGLYWTWSETLKTGFLAKRLTLFSHWRFSRNAAHLVFSLDWNTEQPEDSPLLSLLLLLLKMLDCLEEESSSELVLKTFLLLSLSDTHTSVEIILLRWRPYVLKSLFFPMILCCYGLKNIGSLSVKDMLICFSCTQLKIAFYQIFQADHIT